MKLTTIWFDLADEMTFVQWAETLPGVRIDLSFHDAAVLTETDDLDTMERLLGYLANHSLQVLSHRHDA